MDEDDLEPPKPPLSGAKCARCFEPLPVGARHCPGCHLSTGELPRSLPVILAAAAILAAVFMAVLIYRTNASARVEPPSVEEAAPGGFAPAPETSAGHESPPAPPPGSEKPPQPIAPEKKPPLDR